MTSSEDFTSQPGSRRPSGNPWKQQQLAAFQPILTPRLVIITYLVIGIIFLPLGIAFLTTSDKVVEVASSDYASFNATNLKVTFTNLNIQPPIYMYYQVTEFYQNHRRYVKSRCDEQLRGVYVSPSRCDCDPYAYYNNSGNVQDFLYPCGLQIKNVFNDTFNLVAENSTQTPIPMSSAGITWSTDLDYKFNNPAVNATPQGVRTVQDLKDPDFINWMRVAAFSTFRKLYRIINEPLVGNFTVYVTNNYNVSVFGGKKYVVLATSSWIGGKNQFLGVSYIVVGVVCIVLAFLFMLKQLIKPRLPGDVQYLEWSN